MNPFKELRLKAYRSFYRCLPIKRNKIVIWADSFKHYGCSPKYITEYLLRAHPGQYDLVWVFDQSVKLPSGLPQGVRVVRFFSLDYLKELHTARFIICNHRIGPAYMWKKRRGQRYIQTWHSSLRLKKIEGDAGDNLPQQYIENAKNDSKNIDLIISGCAFSSRIFRNSFWYDGPIMNCGTPRCDLFFSDLKDIARTKVYDRLNLNPKKRLVLFAPTFRNNLSADLHGIDPAQIKQALFEKTGFQWEFLYRFHPNITSTLSDKAGIDVSAYPDMQELLAAADILITDYSSCMFDMAVARKPCFIYAPDLDEYLKNERGLYFKPTDLPFPLATDLGELIKAVSEFRIEPYLAALESFLKSVDSYEDGSASQRITAYLQNNS